MTIVKKKTHNAKKKIKFRFQKLVKRKNRKLKFASILESLKVES